jgi:Peptidase family C25
MDEVSARMQLLNYLNQGQKVVNYFGHGSVDIWRDNILTTEDARTLSNSGYLSLFVPMTCLNGFFLDAAIDGLAESMLKAPNGGAVAAWASSGMCELRDQASQACSSSAQCCSLVSNGAPAGT